MKKYLLSFFTCIAFTSAFAQKTELHFALNSGLFSFSGKAANAVSYISYNDDNQSGHTNNPFGAKSAISYGFSGNLKRITKRNFILGLDLGYESLRSKVTINTVNGYTGNSTYQLEATGKTILSSDFINIFPSLGHRFNTNKVAIDLTGGFDIGANLKMQESGKATAVDGTVFTTDVDRKTISTDVRPRIQVSANYNKMGIYAGYSYGFLSYKAGYVGGSTECVARFVRFGLTYQLF